MEKWVLAVGYAKDKFIEAQVEWLKYHIFVRMESNVQDAIREISRDNTYLLVAIFSVQNDYISELPLLRSLTHAPILIMKQKYDGNEKFAAIEAGANEYIELPRSVIESVASGRALIRGHTEPNQTDDRTLRIFSRGDLFISLDYCKVFIHAVEIQLPRREFDLFYLLASNPDRVFKPEQLYQEVWGEEYVPTENSLHSCVRRIRRKLEAVAETPCHIYNKRGVGYYFSQDTR